jgi:AraC family transcriptional regulator
MVQIDFPIPVIEDKPTIKLIGISMEMSLMNNQTPALWKSFMPIRNQIKNRANDLVVSVQKYQPGYFETFSPTNTFEKWATLEVTDDSWIPEGMKAIQIPSGTYAIFKHEGDNPPLELFQYIFDKWLPESGYHLDQRPHLDWLHENYLNGNRTEAIWIPVHSANRR